MGTDDPTDDLRIVIRELRDVVTGLRSDLAAERAERAALREANERQAARIEELEARVGRNSKNSSKPPSSDGPWSKGRSGRRPRSEKKQGAQPGHPGKTRKLVEPEQVDEIVDHEPQECAHCGHNEILLGVEPPLRHQVTEIPPLVATVTEHRLHVGTCARCGREAPAALPADVPNSAFGPRLQALTVTLVGAYRLSRREVARLLREAFDVSMSTGSVSNIEQRMSKALRSSHDEALAALRVSELAHIDETPWKESGELYWVWTGVSEDVTVHRIDRRRNTEALVRLIGVDYEGIVVSDRMASYDALPVTRRQLCWAHLERQFRGLIQGPPAGRAFGQAGLTVAQALMRAARGYKKHADRERFEAELSPLLGDLIDLLVDGACSDIKGVSGFAAHLLARKDALWLFADRDGVPLTNNTAEREIRKAVLWRKSSFGSQSERGLRFAERILTVSSTKRRRGEGVLDYLVEVARAAISRTPIPSLLAQPARG